MNEHPSKTIQRDREINQYWIDTFTHERSNILDNPIDSLIENIKNKVEKAYTEHDNLVKLQTADPIVFANLEENANRTGYSIFEQMYRYLEETDYLEDELFALMEMKIIYAFKHLEINIKQLLFLAYKDDYINRQFKWDSIIQFLSSKNISQKNLHNSEEINQLRILNNSLKHSSRNIDQSLKNITEFIGKETFGHKELEIFYARIKNSPNQFLTSLVSEVFKDVYTFSYERICEISKTFALRMEKKDAIIFTEELLKLYQ